MAPLIRVFRFLTGLTFARFHDEPDITRMIQEHIRELSVQELSSLAESTVAFLLEIEGELDRRRARDARKDIT